MLVMSSEAERVLQSLKLQLKIVDCMNALLPIYLVLQDRMEPSWYKVGLWVSMGSFFGKNQVKEAPNCEINPITKIIKS